MSPFLTILKSDYLQRTRSYAFLITLCASLAVAYTFVPEPNAAYSTIRIDDHVGYYNAAWFGYVTAIMTSIFLSLIGFYLVNSGIKKDIATKVGQIVASTPVSNFRYLFSKVLSNFLLLITIVGIVFLMSLVLFFLYNDGSSLELMKFIKPYVLITFPAMFFISVLAVVFEVFLGRYSVVQNVGFFFIFSLLMVYSPQSEIQFSFDVFGSKIVIHQLEEAVREMTPSDEKTNLTVGYVTSSTKHAKRFHFNGMDFPFSFIISRFILFALGIAVIAAISPIFHRFNLNQHQSKTKVKPIREKPKAMNDVILTNLPLAQSNYSILPLVKTEFVMLLRNGNKWMWLINLLGMILLAMLPLKIAHQMVLPVLWFLQVNRLSDLTTKEMTNNVHFFAFASYKPMRRVLASQLMAGTLLTFLFSLPLLFRLALSFDLYAMSTLLLGGVFIVFFAALLGILSKGKKLFEVLFFMITYANINGIAFVDYFGGFEHHQLYAFQLVILIVVMASTIFIMRKIQLKNG